MIAYKQMLLPLLDQKSTQIHLSNHHLKILINTLDTVKIYLQNNGFHARLCADYLEVEELKNYLSWLLSNPSDIMGNVQFSPSHIMILNNALNQVCHCLQIDDFSTKIGTSKIDAIEILSEFNSRLSELRNTDKKLDLLPNSTPESSLNLPVKAKCDWQALGYHLTFFGRSLDGDKNAIAVVVVLTTNSDNKDVSIKSQARSLKITQLQDFLSSLENFISHPEGVYFDNCADIWQLEIEAINPLLLPDSDLIMNFNLNVHHYQNGNNDSLYTGAKSLVTLKNLQHFISLMRGWLNKFTTS